MRDSIMFNNDPIDPGFDSDIELARQESEYVDTLKKNSEKLINAITDDKFITVGEARRMSRLSIDISQFPAIQKVFDVIADSDILSSEPIAIDPDEYDSTDPEDEEQTSASEDSEDSMENCESVKTPEKAKRIRRKKKSLTEKLSENTTEDTTNENTVVCADELFGMIDDITQNDMRKKAAPAVHTPAPEQNVEFDPYNRKMNDYDMDELTEDIPTFDIDSGYKLHNL